MASPIGSDLRITRLRCEYLDNPLGIDEPRPRLSWNVESERRGAAQAAYRLLVGDSAEAVADGRGNLWDSGLVASGRSTQIAYAGRPLRSREACAWRVEIVDDLGGRAVSEPGRWTMGLLEPSAWRARWISADPEVVRRDPGAVAPTLTEPGTPGYFRREFQVPGPVRRATLYASARGLFECSLGGRRAGADVFAPEWTDYEKRIHYRTYDVTALVRPGPNVLGAILGDGWWSGYVGWQETRGRYGLENSLLAQLELELASGELLVVATDASWRCNTGPILSSDFMMGEVYDARRERNGWNRQGFDARDWLPAREVEPPKAALVAQRSPPVAVVETIPPASVREAASGAFIYDLGQNLAGWVRLRIRAPAGTRITLRHGERLNPDGTLYTANLRRARATDVYVCKGGGEECWEPHFTFHGFQYVELTGLASEPPAGAVVGCAVRSALPAAGAFDCSEPKVNRLWLNALWGQRSNFLSVPTDCPQRDERLGWMGDAQVFLRTAAYNMDVAAFFTKWMTDVEDAQTPEGIFPDVAPRVREDRNFVGLDGLCGAAGWADAGVIVPWTIWRVYGDLRIVERHWEAMVRWLEWIEGANPDGLRTRKLGNNYGDWLCLPSDTSFRTQSPMKDLLATAYWADDASKLAQMARALGREPEAERFSGMAERVKAAFQRAFLGDKGRLKVETQTAYVLALAFRLIPEEARAGAARRLVELIRRRKWHLATGFIGISHLNPTLTLAGRADVAHRLLLTEDYPSWLYPVLHGATTIWERWNGWTEKDGFFDPQMNSFNHYSLGSVGEWLFRHVAGIELDPEVPGFKRFVLKPWPGKGLGRARASYRSAHGEIVSSWRLARRRFEWEVRVPANTTATVCLPSDPEKPAFEGGRPIEDAPGIRFLGREGDRIVCETRSGCYAFKSTWTPPG